MLILADCSEKVVSRWPFMHVVIVDSFSVHSRFGVVDDRICMHVAGRSTIATVMYLGMCANFRQDTYIFERSVIAA